MLQMLQFHGLLYDDMISRHDGVEVYIFRRRFLWNEMTQPKYVKTL